MAIAFIFLNLPQIQISFKTLVIMKTLKTFAAFAAAFILAMGISSCGNKTSKLQAQLDSLATADSLHQEDVKQMVDFVNVMSIGLDSISAQEGLIRSQQPTDTKRIDKAQLRQQLNTLGQLLQNQRQRIVELEAQVKDNNSAYGQKIKKLIAYYKAELDQKDRQIADLNAQLDAKNTDIAKLNESVSNLTTSNEQMASTIETQKQTVADQQTVISKQDAELNKGYVFIGTSKELKAKGLIKGGFLKKTKVQVENLSATGFQEVDIRKYNDVKLNSKSPKVMTQMPASSYTITGNADGTTTLHISDPKAFWSVSNYLVVKL